MKSLLPWALGGALVAAIGVGVAAAPGSRGVSPRDSASSHPVADRAEEPAAEATAPLEPGPDTTLTGVVQEHHDVSQYTYVRLATASGEAWAAVYRAPVNDGDEVTVDHATPLEHFHSRELARDFDRIWFGVLPGYETARAAPSASASAAPSSKSAAMVPSQKGLKPAPGALAIADLAKRAGALDGKVVTVSGRVVKENDGILGRNWIHLQDGTGSAVDGTNDVLVTSEKTSKVGEQVIVNGKVRTKQDFGAGYAYPFMIEGASFQTNGL